MKWVCIPPEDVATTIRTRSEQAIEERCAHAEATLRTAGVSEPEIHRLLEDLARQIREHTEVQISNVMRRLTH